MFNEIFFKKHHPTHERRIRLAKGTLPKRCPEIDRIAASSAFNSVSLLDGTGGTVNIQVGIASGGSNVVAVDLSASRTATDLGIGVGVDTAVNANTAMTEIDSAIENVATARSGFGAVQNRLETSIRNIDMTAENLSAANSRIRDVDIAHETSRMTSYQILQQAGVAMLSQANMSTGLAMNLLQG